MKFHHLNISNFMWLVPDWLTPAASLARQIDQMLGSFYTDSLEHRRADPHKAADFMIEASSLGAGVSLRLATGIGDDPHLRNGHLVLNGPSPMSDRAQTVIPLEPLLKGHESIVGSHSVYWHTLDTDVSLVYVGTTRQPWFKRLNQHISSANRGSHLLFHRAIREHSDKAAVHRPFLVGLSFATAMKYEEEFVQMIGLYPLGLNMIPGGLAGLKYLSSLGIVAASAADRDEALERLSTQPELLGRPNPLCAARWASDPDFVERVICGHSGRLTAEQVRSIRTLAPTGRSIEEITTLAGARNQRQAERVLNGKHYGRIQ